MVLHNMLRGQWRSKRSAHTSIANRYLRETSGHAVSRAAGQ